MEYRVTQRTFKNGLISDDGASMIGQAMSVETGHGLESHGTRLALVIRLSVSRDDVGSDELHLRINDGFATFRALISRTTAKM